MVKITRRRSGEGTLFWNERRQRWMAVVDVGFSPKGKRRRVQVSARTKTEAKAKLLALRRDQADGLPPEQRGYTVGEAVESWLRYGLVGRDPSTVTNRRIMAEKHIIPALGSRRLMELTAEEVDGWLAAKAQVLSTDSVARLLSILRQSIRRAQARDLVRRNVALLCDAPRGKAGRPSKALTLGPGAGGVGGGRGHVDERVRGGVAVHRSPDRGAAGADLEAPGLGR